MHSLGKPRCDPPKKDAFKMQKESVEFNPALKLSLISQLFQSRLGCYACIFPSGKKKKSAVNLLSISATQAPKRLRDLLCFLGCSSVRCPLVCAVETSQLDVKIVPPSEMILVKFVFCPPPLPSFTKQHFLPPDCGRSD